MPSIDPRGDGSPQLLARTFAVLALFTPERREWTVTEIGRACGLAVPTVHRIVSALHRNDFLARDEDSKRYRLGPVIMQLGRTAAMTIDLRSVARPVMRRIAAKTRETTLLTVVADDMCRAVCVDRVESVEPLRLSIQPGREMPLHAGASQKVLLAHMQPHDVDECLRAPLVSCCRSTIVDPAVLRTELDLVRARGWADSFEETNLGVWGLAVALLDEHGLAVAALGIAGPRERRPRMVGPWLALLASGADEIARSLGLSPSLVAHPASVARPAAAG